MKHLIYSFVIFLTIGFSVPAFAQDHLEHEPHASEGTGHRHGSHPECPLPKSAMDVVKCAAENHPQARRFKLASEHSKTLTNVAKQIPNPDLDVEVTVGRNDSSSTDIGILQPIELGGKRSARVRLSEAQISQSGAELEDVQADIIRETVKNVHRLRQLDIEKGFLSDTIATLQKIISQQSARPALTPEQQVTLSVYRMALADARIKESEAFEEERALEHYFHVSTGHSLSELRPVLPKAPESWPDVSKKSKSQDSSPALRRALADKSFALSELTGAQASAWPTVRIGPMIKLERDSDQSTNLYGIRLMMDLPLLNTNSGGRAHARAGLLRSEKLIELTRAEEGHERAEQLKVYNSAVQALKNAPTVAAIEKEFSRNQTLARRGLISGALLIEFHRQRSDLIHSRNGRELKAIEALWQIHKFDGRIFSESL